MKKVKKILVGIFAIVGLVTLSSVIAGVHDVGENEVYCDNECIVSSSFWGLVRICDAGTDSCIHKYGAVKIVDKPTSEDHEQ